jgi:cytochrome c
MMILSILAPPLVLATTRGCKILGIIGLLLWILVLYVFFEISVIGAVVLHSVTIFISVFYVVRQVNNESFIYFGKLPVTLIVAFFISLINSIYILNYRVYEVKPVLIQVEKTIKGEVLFAQCLVCHRLSNDNFVGPSLAKVYGRKAGSVDNYNYSNGMKNANFFWSNDNLLKFLINQNEVVPGTNMVISPLPKDDILNIIEYLKTK